MADGAEVFQVQPPAAPEYQAASRGRRARFWGAWSVGPNVATSGAKQTIVARSRNAIRNDPWAGTASDKLVSNAIGTGIQAKTRNGSKEFKAQVKKLWDAWAKWADADWVLDFAGLQALVMREWHEAGEVFVRLRKRRPGDGLPVPLQVQLIEAEQCPAEKWSLAPNGNQIRAGIEFDGIGRRVAYWMYRSHPGDTSLDAYQGELVRVPADDVVHVYAPMRAGQIRGLPHATSALARMFNLDSFDDALLERQKLANLFTGFWEDDSGNPEELPGVNAELQTSTDTDGTPLAGLEPGSVVEGPPGKKLKFSDPPDAGPNYPAYWRAQLLAISARHGVPYEVLTGDLKDVSDRALRLILNEFRRLIEQWQWLTIIPLFCQMVREAWWDQAVLAGLIDAPGYAEKREDYVDTLWVPQGWPYSHPVQDLDADKGAVRSGFTSRTEVVLANGDDPEEVDAQLAADNVRADTLGLVLDSDPRKVSNAGLTQERVGLRRGDDDAERPNDDGAAARAERAEAAATEARASAEVLVKAALASVETAGKAAQAAADRSERSTERILQVLVERERANERQRAELLALSRADNARAQAETRALVAEIAKGATETAKAIAEARQAPITVNLPPPAPPAEMSEREVAALAALEQKIEAL